MPLAAVAVGGIPHVGKGKVTGEQGITDPGLHGAMTLCHYGQSHGKMSADEGH